MSVGVIAALGPAYEVAKTVAGAVSVVALGESVAKRVGVLGEDKTVLGEATHFVLDVAGVPRDSALRPAQRPAQLPAANAPSLPSVEGVASRAVCPSCVEGPILAGSAGEEIVSMPCDAHQEEMRRSALGLGALVEGYETALNLGQSVCGPKPKVKTKKMHPKFPEQPDWTTYYRELNEYKDCLAAEKAQQDAQKAATAKAVDDAAKAGKKKGAETQKKLSQMALAAKSSQYQKQIEDLKAQQAAELDALRKVDLQKQIDDANQKKAVAEALAAELQAKSKDDAFAEKIAALETTIASQAKQPGGMDQLLQTILLQQMQQMQSQQAAAAQPFAAAPPVTMFVPPVVPWAPAPEMLPNDMTVPVPAQGDFASPYDYVSYFGVDEEAPLDPDIAAEFGVEGDGLTVGQGFELMDLTQAGELDSSQIEEVAKMFARDNDGIQGCITGSCGLR